MVDEVSPLRIGQDVSFGLYCYRLEPIAHFVTHHSCGGHVTNTYLQFSNSYFVLVLLAKGVLTQQKEEVLCWFWWVQHLEERWWF